MQLLLTKTRKSRINSAKWSVIAMKSYIRTNLANGLIISSKYLIEASIFFVKKLNKSFWLCINYRELNNFTMKNSSPLTLISEFLNQLVFTKHFTQLDLTNTYDQIWIWEGDKWKRMLKTWYNHFKYQVMSFSLSNVSASF